MNTSDITDTLGKAKDQAVALTEEAGALAKDHLIRPAQKLVRESRRSLAHAADSVTDSFSHVSGEAADLFYGQRDRAAGWISRNPFAAIAAAAGAGMLLTMLVRKRG